MLEPKRFLPLRFPAMPLKRLFAALCLMTGLSIALSGFVAVCDWPYGWAYLLDILSAPLLIAAVPVTALLILLRQKGASILGLTGLVLFLAALWPQIAPLQRPAADGAPLKLMFANLYDRNPEPQRLIPWIESEDPDVVATVEAGWKAGHWMAPKLTDRYPYRVQVGETAIFSRYPLGPLKQHMVGHSLTLVSVYAPGGRFTLAIAHLTRPWPFSKPRSHARQASMLIQATRPYAKGPLIMVGDFNSTPAAATLRRISHDLCLIPAPVMTGTWPAGLPIRVGIDNVLTSKHFTLRNRRTGPADYGSDHLPVRVDVYRTAPASQAGTRQNIANGKAGMNALHTGQL